ANFATGTLEAFLTSPDGTTSQLFYTNKDQFVGASLSDNTKIDWTFTSNAFWGEDEAGMWTLNVRDVAVDGLPDLGATNWWENYSVTLNTGDLIPVPEPSSLVLASLGLVMVVSRVRRRHSAR